MELIFVVTFKGELQTFRLDPMPDPVKKDPEPQPWSTGDH